MAWVSFCRLANRFASSVAVALSSCYLISLPACFSITFRKSPNRYGGLRRVLQGVGALCWFVVCTIVLPAAHISSHWNDHIHTPGGVVYLDGQIAAGPTSMDEVLAEIKAAAFGGVPYGHNEVEALSSRFSSSPQLSSDLGGHEGLVAHGSGSLLHFGLLFHGTSPSLVTSTITTLLRQLVPTEPSLFFVVARPLAQHIRGPPSRA